MVCQAEDLLLPLLGYLTGEAGYEIIVPQR